MTRVFKTKDESYPIIIIFNPLKGALEFKILIRFSWKGYSNTRIVKSPDFTSVLPWRKIPHDCLITLFKRYGWVIFCWLQKNCVHCDKLLYILAAWCAGLQRGIIGSTEAPANPVGRVQSKTLYWCRIENPVFTAIKRLKNKWIDSMNSFFWEAQTCHVRQWSSRSVGFVIWPGGAEKPVSWPS